MVKTEKTGFKGSKRLEPLRSTLAPSTHSKDAADGNSGFPHMTAEIYAIIIGCGAGILVVFILFLIICRKRSGKGNSRDLTWDDEEKYVTKSAPISRHSSPKMKKRKSCPETSAPFTGMMVRSMTTHGIPDFTLPPERVQPTNIQGRRFSVECTHSPLGNVQPDLYQGYGTDDENLFHLAPSDHGRLWFCVVYDAAVEQLQITLVKVKELVGRSGDKGKRDPFVKVFLLPDERSCRMSKVKKRTLAPIYNETFVFQVSPDDIRERTVRFSVYDVDKRRIRHSLGHILIPLKDFDLTKGETIWRDLENNSKISATLGELCFSLNYLPTIDKVKVIIRSGRNLSQINYDEDIGVYVRIQMMHGRKIYRAKKTVTQKANSNPTFNESFSFNIAGKVLDSCSFEVAVMRSSRKTLGTDDVYGRVVIGSFMFARGPELIHWQEMLSNARNPVTKWHMLS